MLQSIANRKLHAQRANTRSAYIICMVNIEIKRIKQHQLVSKHASKKYDQKNHWNRNCQHNFSDCWNQPAISTGPSTSRRSGHASNFFSPISIFAQTCWCFQIQEAIQYASHNSIFKNNKAFHCRKSKKKGVLPSSMV